MGAGADFAMQAGQQVVGAGLGMLLGHVNDKRQLKQQRKLQDLQIKGNKEMIDYSKAADLKMWMDTGPGAYKKLLEDADLNAALMYGMGGGSGQTTGGGSGGVSGGNAPSGGREIQDMSGMAMQLGLMNAQKENIEADTANKKAQAIKTAGVDTGKASAEIASLTQGIENQKAVEALTKVETEIKNTELYIKTKTADQQVRIVEYEAEKQFESMEAIGIANNVNRETMQIKIDMAKAEYVGMLIQNNLNVTKEEALRIGMELTKAQTEAARKGMQLTDATIKSVMTGTAYTEEQRQGQHMKNKNIEREQIREDDYLDLEQQRVTQQWLNTAIEPIKRILSRKVINKYYLP